MVALLGGKESCRGGEDTAIVIPTARLAAAISLSLSQSLALIRLMCRERLVGRISGGFL